jgi:hypothetical protein
MSFVMKSKKFAGVGGKRMAYAESGGGEQLLVLVGHDWGSAPAFDLANHHRDRVVGIQEDSGPEIGRAIAPWAGRL